MLMHWNLRKGGVFRRSDSGYLTLCFVMTIGTNGLAVMKSVS